MRFLLFSFSIFLVPLFCVAKKSCPYPESPINWVVQYCGFVTDSADELNIQKSKCFKNAAADLANRDECSINKKYKSKVCEFMIKQKITEDKSVADCLKNKDVGPFVAGE